MSPEPQRWPLEEAVEEAVDGAALEQLVVDLVDIPSPTGEERPLAEFIAGHLQRGGVDAEVQPIDDRQANVVGRLPGSGRRPSLLLYAPIDTHMSGDPRQDTPGEAIELRPDMVARATVADGRVLGLGANNPKGHAACVIAAAEALAAAQVPLAGDVIIGLGAGGMPAVGRTGDPLGRRHVGHGRGCAFMFDHGLRPDMAVIAKPGPVSWEEVGLAVILIRVHGRFDYAGVRHRGPYRNPILDAAKLIGGLEEWFPAYTRRHTSGSVEPQASIGWIEAGWREKPTFVPAVCDLQLDLRISPRTSIADARRELEAAIDQLRHRWPDLRVEWDVVAAVPGTWTDPDHPVVQACIRSWEAVSGERYRPATGKSGATDANILRLKGVPTARLGMPPVTGESPVPDDFSRGMNLVDVQSARRLTRTLVRVALDLCATTP